MRVGEGVAVGVGVLDVVSDAVGVPEGDCGCVFEFIRRGASGGSTRAF